MRIEDYYEPNNAVAILCHECTHYFMEYNRLNWNDTSLNEQRTDIVANLLGFSRIMSAGYKAGIKDINISGNVETTTKYKLGYITNEDCEDVGEFLEWFREQLREKQNTEREISGIMEKISKYIETAKTLAEQLEYIDLTKINAGTPERVAKIQGVLLEKGNRNISAEIMKHTELITWLAVLQEN